MTITALPTPPSRADDPATFASKGDALLGALPTFVTETNATAAHVDAQVVVATTQVSLATDQVGLATTQAGIATTQAILATSVSATAASSAAFKGVWSALTGALSMPASVFHAGAFWALNTPLADITTATPGISAAWTKIKFGADVYTYANRANLRSTAPQTNDKAIVEGLGLFVFEEGSSEPDDDESCFATASGKWLLQAASWDLIDAWQAPDDAARDDFDEDAAAKTLTGSATCAITSVYSIMSASFAGTVTGATVGDRVIATPPAQLGSSAEFTGQLSYHAWVSAADTVTIMLTNASAGSATTNAAIRTAWPITVIKS